MAYSMSATELLWPKYLHKDYKTSYKIKEHAGNITRGSPVDIILIISKEINIIRDVKLLESKKAVTLKIRQLFEWFKTTKR